MLGKKLNQFKQLFFLAVSCSGQLITNAVLQFAGEKIGSTQRTETSEDFMRLSHDTDLMNDQSQNVFDAFQGYLKSLGKRGEGEKPKKSPIEVLGSAMVMYGNQLPPDSTYGQTLLKVGEAQESVAAAQAKYVSEVSAGYVTRLNQILYDMKEFYTLKKKMENRRLDFDAKHNTAMKSKKDPNQLLEEVNQAKIKYEETLNDVTQRMVRLNMDEDDQLNDLLEFVDLEVAHYQKSLKILLQLQSDLESVPRNSQKVKRVNSSTSSYHKTSFADEDRSHTPTDKKLLKAAQTGSLVFPAQAPDGSIQAPPRPRDFSVSSSPNVQPTVIQLVQAQSHNFLKQARVTFDFDAEGEDELTIRKGEIINITAEIDEGWWEGEIADGSGRFGMFPSNYCEVLRATSVLSSKTVYQEPDDSGPPISYSSPSSRVTSSATVTSRVKIPPPVAGPSPVNQKISSSVRGSMNMSSSTPRSSVGKISNQCGICDCDDFKPHSFKPGICCQCYHSH
ncbi:hypothetical protein HK098_008359 [Nowakowskiella sp. JEL0407]|nr:hypothetical protein HK098_008359 [Nowakowskiella sp. JEL0407]